MARAPQGLPTNVFGYYYLLYDQTPVLSGLPSNINTAILFNAEKSGTAGTYVMNYTKPTGLDAYRDGNKRAVLSFGGAGNGLKFDTRTKSNNLIASVASINTAWGGTTSLPAFDGVDLNTFETGGEITSQAIIDEYVYIAQQLKTTYGANFVVTMPPAPWRNNFTDGNDLGMATALKNAGVLDYAGPQWYDGAEGNGSTDITTQIDTWSTAIGESRLVVGQSANYATGLTVAQWSSLWDTIETAHPAIRGAFAWSHGTDRAASYTWASTLGPKVLPSGGGGGVAAHVQSTGNFSGAAGTTVVKAFASNVTVGNVIVIGAEWNSTTQTCAVTDTLGNTYTAVAGSLSSANSIRTQIFWAPVTTGGACTVTMTCSGSNGYRVLTQHEYSGLATTGQPEASNAATGTSAAPAASVTTLSANALVFGFCRSADAAVAGAGFTQRVNQDGNTSEDKIQAAAGTVSVAYTQGSAQWAVAAASFAVSGGGGATPAVLGSLTGSATAIGAMTLRGSIALGSLTGSASAAASSLTLTAPAGGGTVTTPPLSVPALPARPPLTFYKFELAQSSDLSRIGELTHASGRSLQLALNKAGAFSCTLPLDDALTDLVREVETCVIISRDNQIIWSGPIWAINETVSASAASVQISAVGWLQTLDKRVVRPTWNSNQPMTYTNQDAGLIALDLLTRSNLDAADAGAPIYIFPGAAEITQLRTRSYPPWAGVLASLNELTDIESGFDMLVDPGTRKLNISMRVGSDNGVAFELPGTVNQINRVTDSGRILNYLTAYSATGAQADADYDSIAKLGLFEEAQSLSDVVDPNILAAYAAGEVFVKGRPLRIITFQPRAETIENPSLPRVIRDYNIGDIVRLTVNHGRLRLNRQPLRIFSFSLNFPDTGGASVSDIQTTLS